MRPFLMLIFSCILILVGCQSRTEDYDTASCARMYQVAFITDKRAR